MKYTLILFLLVGICFSPSIIAQDKFDDTNKSVMSNQIDPASWSNHDLKYEQVRDVNYAYLESGEGFPIVFLHGFPDLAITWNETMDEFSATNRCIAPFLTGYFPTGIPSDGDYRVKTIAEDIVTLLDNIGVDEFYLVGQDWGATISYSIANLVPDRVKKLVTVAVPHGEFIKPSIGLLVSARHFITFRNERKSVKKVRKNDFAYIEKLITRWSPGWTNYQESYNHLKTTLELPGRVEAMLGYYWSFNKAGKDEQLSNFYKDLPTMPTLTFAGQKDGAMPSTKLFHKMKEGMPADFQLRISETGGHFLHQDDFLFFIKELKLFLE